MDEKTMSKTLNKIGFNLNMFFLAMNIFIVMSNNNVAFFQYFAILMHGFFASMFYRRLSKIQDNKESDEEH